ncbi:HAD family hydrolase [Candidatus Woesearchaeota archaeon]|nr:HAD family hydrolase [Candidatus Woesearchaeota archaeon]
MELWKKEEDTVPKKEVKAILFDLDGVLVDSIDAWYYTYDDIIRYFKAKPMPKKEFKNIFGNTIEANVRRIVKITTKEANRLAIKYFSKNYKYVKIFPQTKSVLKKLSNSKAKIALITNTPNKILNLVLKHHKIKKYFNAIVTIDDVKKGKPAPDMALKACRLLRVKPENTILVGDTKNDMLAGKRAGCITVGYKTKGDYRIDNLESITRFLN